MRTCPIVVVDSSVAIKWFREGEESAAVARRLLDDHVDNRIVFCAPTLLLLEVANVLRFKPQASDSFVQKAMRDLHEIHLLLVPVVRLLLESAITLSFHYGLSIYDATFVALAQEMEAEFVTADERLADRLAALPFAHSLRRWPLV